MRQSNIIYAITCLNLVFALSSQTAWAQATAFTYQGKLTDAGGLANVNYDLQFKLFDTLTGGTQQGATLTRNPVAASDGVFTVMLDFGANVFTGAARFLEIGVRPTGSASAYTVLAPRQMILSSPYAIQTLNATQLGGVDASQYVTTTNGGASFIRNTVAQQASANFNISGNGVIGGAFGVGGIIPPAGTLLQVHSSGSVASMVFSTSAGTEGPARIRLQADSGLFGQGRSLVIYDDVAAQYRLVINGQGNFGIGLTNPATKLQIAAGSSAGVHVTSGANAIIGLSTTPSFAAIYGENTTSGSFGVFGRSGSNGTGVQGEGSPGVAGSSVAGFGVYGKSTGDITKSGVYGESSFGAGVTGVGKDGVRGITTSTGFGYGVYGEAVGGNPLSSAGYFNGWVAITGTLVIYQDLSVTGDKNFVEPHPTDPNKMIAYVALEGPEAGTYFRGSGRIVGGTATLQVPEDFRMVTDEKGLTVQVTPMGAPATIWCVRKSLDKIELRGSADVEFDYLVNGVRRASKDHQPIVENTVFVPRSADDPLFKNLKPEALRRLKATGILNEDGSINMETVKQLDAYKRWFKSKP
jgi:hypothetical protein